MAEAEPIFYNPEGNPRDLSGEWVPPTEADLGLPELRRDVAQLGSAADVFASDGWRNRLRPTIEGAIEQALLQLAGDSDLEITRLHFLRGRISGLKYLLGLSEQVKNELATTQERVAEAEEILEGGA